MLAIKWLGFALIAAVVAIAIYREFYEFLKAMLLIFGFMVVALVVAWIWEWAKEHSE